ncbi:hypothetical protein ACFSO7_15955 [Bacillus sp. CGMCC 1.16607]|uniref:hypothetical protein n=1 Tax=Bacillus sp. CGMCC 1.16607 TaxID=3351842 RepID=UPI00363726FA
MLVKEVYLDCFTNEYSSLAHYLYHLLAEEKILLDDDISKIDLYQADHQIVAELVQNNVLGIHKVNIYSLRRSRKEFIFIFAVSEQDAIQFYQETFHQTPVNCHEYPLDFEIIRGNEVISLREMRKEFVSFPVVAGYYKKIV